MTIVTEVEIEAGDQRLPASIARPAGGEPRPAVIVLHEAFGLNDDMRRICRRFAEAGYAALAPDFLAGLGPQPLCMARFIRALGRVGDGRPYRQMAAVRRWLGADPEIDERRIGVAGFCVGGGFALLYAASAADVRVVAPFYAAVPAEAARTFREICPVVASYGGRDRVFGRLGPRLDDVLSRAGVEHDVKTYPEAGHSFMNRPGGVGAWLGQWTPMRAGYHEASAEDAWRRTLEFFGRHLGPPDDDGSAGNESAVR